jgi:hypothetical protein
MIQALHIVFPLRLMYLWLLMESHEGARSFLLSSGGDEHAAPQSPRVIHARVQ